MDSNLNLFAWVGLVWVLLSCLILVGVTVASVLLLKRASQQTQEGEAALQRIAARVPPEGQAIFNVRLNEVKKKPTDAVALALFLGGVGLHKFYLNETVAGILMLIFCWTGIPVFIGFVEAFTIADKTNRYNNEKAIELAILLGADL